jgi:hypothetical protein
MKLKIFTIGFLLFFVAIHSQMQNPKKIPFSWKTDTTKFSIDKSEIQIVMPKGSFPKIDFPEFLNKGEGLVSYYKKEPVIAVEINGNAKAYPLNILTFHEITNDTLSGVPILATYCPLCNSGLVFNRKLKHNNKEYLLEFDVSGMLRKSDMIMLDRNTETLWQQLLGTAIVGDLDTAQLEILPSLIISVEAFFRQYPNGKIMSNKTNDQKLKNEYGHNPYKKYDDLSSSPYQRFFKKNKISNKLPAMERIVDIQDQGDYKVYTFTAVKQKEVINDTFKSKKVVLFYQKGTVSILDENKLTDSKDIGSVTVFRRMLDGKEYTFKKEKNLFVDCQTNSFWNAYGYCYQGKLKEKQLKIETHSNHFAFAWFAFHPNTIIYK